MKLRTASIPYVVIKWIAFLLRFREALVSSLGSETNYNDRFLWVSSVPSGKCLDSRPTLKLGHDHFLAHPFQFASHLSPFLRRCIARVTEKALLNKNNVDYITRRIRLHHMDGCYSFSSFNTIKITTSNNPGRRCY